MAATSLTDGVGGLTVGTSSVRFAPTGITASIPPGGSVVLMFQAQAETVGTFTNSATVTTADAVGTPQLPLTTSPITISVTAAPI